MKSKKQPLFRVGPVTKAMILGIAAFTAYTVWSRPAEPGVRRYEVGADGRPVEVAVSATPASIRLWKPEPHWLLDNAGKLNLSSDQKLSIQAVAGKWALRKRSLTDSMRSELDAAKVDSKRSLGDIRNSLAGYSDLSRRYELERIAAWDQAAACLTESQKSAVEKEARS